MERGLNSKAVVTISLQCKLDITIGVEELVVTETYSFTTRVLLYNEKDIFNTVFPPVEPRNLGYTDKAIGLYPHRHTCCTKLRISMERRFYQEAIDPRYGHKPLQNSHAPEIGNYFAWPVTGIIFLVFAKNCIF